MSGKMFKGVKYNKQREGVKRLFLNYFMQHNLGPERLDRGPRREEEVPRRGQSMIFERGRQFGTAKKDLKSSSMQSICSLTV